MVFSSTFFLFLFLPITFILALILPSIRAKNWLLIVMSLVFYAFGEPVYILLMLFSVVMNYVLGRIVGRKDHTAKPTMILAVVLNLALLCLFKYTGFLCELWNGVTGIVIPVPQIRLPIGISFYTFQALSYVIDVYRGDTPAQKRFSNVLLYISLFPQLIAGPILKYHDVEQQIDNRTVTSDAICAGIRRFVFGLSKKLLLANTVGAIADSLFGGEISMLGAPAAWLGAIAYCFQIYFDFSGYSDMAIGLGRMFGFSFAENFNDPYTAQSIQDFWRRWHISLSTWFKEYLYIPLGGNRKGKFRTGINKLIVFFCTGLWHGANLTFVVWGLFHGLFIMLESYGVLPVGKWKFRPIRHLYTLLVVCTGFVIFRADTISQAIAYLGQMFAGFPVTHAALASFTAILSPYHVVILLLCVLFSTSLLKKIPQNSRTEALSYAAVLPLFFLCLTALASSTYNPFIYFRF